MEHVAPHGVHVFVSLAAEENPVGYLFGRVQGLHIHTPKSLGGNAMHLATQAVCLMLCLSKSSPAPQLLRLLSKWHGVSDIIVCPGSLSP